METSAKHQTVKSRPAVLLVLVLAGLFCASWLTINKNGGQNSDTELSTAMAMADTTIDKRKDKKKDKIKEKGKSGDERNEGSEKSATYSRKTITTYDEEGNPHEEVIEEFDGDEELRTMFSGPGSFNFTMPAIPAIPAIPSVNNSFFTG